MLSFILSTFSRLILRFVILNLYLLAYCLFVILSAVCLFGVGLSIFLP